ncbi:MAG: hypothetical protein ACK5X3_01710, partial [Pseudomonadota bacterium]
DALGWCPGADTFEAALLAGHWNIGGERIWLAPERAFNFSDPARMLDTYHVDPALDPGTWSLTSGPAGVALEASSTISRTDGGGPISVKLSRRITLLQAYAGRELPEDLILAGYRQSIEVTYSQFQDGFAIVPWLVRQVALGGDAMLSASGSGRGERVFGKPPPDAITPRKGRWLVRLGPQGFFKTSYSRHVIGAGGLGYMITAKGQATALVLRPVLVAPDQYPETLPHDTGSPGQAAARLCDDGPFGRYGELDLYGHKASKTHGKLGCDTLFLSGTVKAVSAALASQATEMSSMPIS